MSEIKYFRVGFTRPGDEDQGVQQSELVYAFDSMQAVQKVRDMWAVGRVKSVVQIEHPLSNSFLQSTIEVCL